MLETVDSNNQFKKDTYSIGNYLQIIVIIFLFTFIIRYSQLYC